MGNNQEKNKRIAKNTLLLYFRMFLMMGVSLYTSRVILQALGVEDYGIYNVVGGIVSMFSLLSGSLSAAITRFINYEMGKNNLQKLNHIFSSSITVQCLLGCGVFILAETLGLWFLNYKMNIPVSRLEAANWIFQFSIITFIINLISIPYNALIIAHERMQAFAYISIMEALLKLGVAGLIFFSIFDKLILYGLLICLTSLVVRFVYGYYCKRHFEESKYHFIYDKALLKKIFNFAGWNFLGAGSSILMIQGVDILMNLFFGVTMNAARAVANQANNAIQQFTGNFSTAINPQITQSYAAGEITYTHKLVCEGSKYSYFLTLLLSLPIIFESPTVLNIWLDNVPNHAPLFLQLTLIITLISVFSNTLVTLMLATGNIKRYQITVGGLGMLILPFSYLGYKTGFPVETSYFIHITIFALQLVARLFLLKNMTGLQINYFVKNSILKGSYVTLLSIILPLLITTWLPPSFQRLILTITASTLSICISIYFIGIGPEEKSILRSNITKIKSKLC